MDGGQTPEEAIATLYVAYFGRAPDPDGFAYWRGRYTDLAADLGDSGAVATIADAFAASEEARTRYPVLAEGPDVETADAAGFVDAVYRNTFDRSPEGQLGDTATGLGGWTAVTQARVAEGQSVGPVVAEIAFGAQGATVVGGFAGAPDVAVDDRARLDAKVAAAQAYAAEAATPGLPDDAPADAAYRVIDAAGRLARTPEELVTFATRPRPEPGLDVRVIGAPDTVALYADRLEATAEAAWDVWQADFARSAEIELIIDLRPGTAVARGAAATSVETGETATGRPIEASGVAWELATGQDPNGAAADARLTIEAQPERFAFRTETDAPLPADKLDALTVMIHEFGHILGITSFRDDVPSSDGVVLSNWDRHVDLTGDTPAFVGPAARLAFGGPVPLDAGDPAHVALPDALMQAGIGFGESVQPGELDRALIQDTGVPVGANPVELFA